MAGYSTACGSHTKDEDDDALICDMLLRNAESQGARALRQQATRAATSNRFAATIQPLNARTSQVVSS